MHRKLLESLDLKDNDPRQKDELEKLAVSNLQNIIYQANPDLLDRWKPIIVSALNAGVLGNELISAYGYFSMGQHENLAASLKILESVEYEEKYFEELNFERVSLRIRAEFNYGNFDKVEQLYDSITELLEKYVFRTESQLFSFLRTRFLVYFFTQNKKKFEKDFQRLQKKVTSEINSIALMHLSSYKAMHHFLNGEYKSANEFSLAAIKVAEDLSK